LDIFRVVLAIDFDLTLQILASFADQMAVMKRFDSGLQRQRDKEADCDRHKVKQEVLPGPRRVMNRMNIHMLSPR
jgi:hypothetical protein